MNAIDVALGCADSNFTKASVTGTLAAEVRRLREENERLRNIERAAQWYVDNPNSQRMAISQIKAAIDPAGCEMTTSVLKMQRELVAVTEERDRLAAELQKLQEQKPVAYEDYWKSDGTGIVRRQPSNGRPLFAAPVATPAVPVGASLATTDAIARAANWYAPAVPAPSVPEGCAIVSRTLTPEAWKRLCNADIWPVTPKSFQRMLNVLMEVAMLQSADHSEQALEKVAPDCRSCANRGRVNGLSQESCCDSCVYQGRDWRQNHFVDAVKRRCEACAILPCSCK